VAQLAKCNRLPDRTAHAVSTVAFLRSSTISLKNDAKPRYTFAPFPNDFAYEKHALQNYAKRFVSIRSQMLYPVELRAPEREAFNLRRKSMAVK